MAEKQSASPIEDDPKRVKKEKKLTQESRGKSLTESEKTTFRTLNALRDMGLVPKEPWDFQVFNKIFIDDIKIEKGIIRIRTASFVWGHKGDIGGIADYNGYREVTVTLKKYFTFSSEEQLQEVNQEDKEGWVWHITNIEVDTGDRSTRSGIRSGKIKFEGEGATNLLLRANL